MGLVHSFILPSIHAYLCLSDPHLSSLKNSGLDGSSMWESLLSYKVLRGARGGGGEWGNTYTIVEQSSRSILPAVAYVVNNCKLHFVGKSTFSLIRHAVMLLQEPKCLRLRLWLHIASGMQIVFVYVPLCVHSLPMPGASQTWGGKTLFENGI